MCVCVGGGGGLNTLMATKKFYSSAGYTFKHALLFVKTAPLLALGPITLWYGGLGAQILMGSPYHADARTCLNVLCFTYLCIAKD